MEKEIYTFEKIVELIKSTGDEQNKLHNKAKSIRNQLLSNKVYYRGLIEFSNLCENDCFYCGIRKSNGFVNRYSMTKDEIIETVKWCNNNNYGSVVLQSGQLHSKNFIDFVEDVLKEIKNKYPDIGITLCVGEQTKDTYKRFFLAGAHRYLLRIETSDKEHYEKLHPEDMKFIERKRCLKDLQEIGFQVGTGIMVGTTYQTVENLANDLLFFKEFNIDMVGMGPFIPHNQTPIKVQGYDKETCLNFSLNMIAVLRLMMPKINIAATTALQAIDKRGREKGLNAGANILMPIVTPQKYRDSYLLYDGKPCVEESSEDCLVCLTNRIKSVGMDIGFGEWGDSRSFYDRRGFDNESFAGRGMK